MFSAHAQAKSNPEIRETRLWISDEEVRAIFSVTRCMYFIVSGNVKRESDGVFVCEKRSKEGTLGRVYRNPLNSEKWLWVISKKTRKPFALAKVG